MSAPIVAILNLSLSVVTAAFVPLVVTNMPWNALPICLLNWSMLLIATVFLPLMKISVIFSSMTAPFLTVFFMQLTASFPVCFSNLINPKTSLPALSWFYTFGRDLKWNPHIHCLLSEGGFSDDGFWRHVSHFNYSYLRNAFRTALLNEMHSKIGPSFKKIKSKCYNDHKQGFYVYAKPNLSDSKTVIKYIGRYLGRPVIATSRIDNYDGDTVTFHYNRHEDNKYIVETLPAIDFIKRLIRHIPEKHFKMIRYGGLYARHRKTDEKLYRAISKSKHRIYRSFNQWRTAILSSFGYDPLECPNCKHKMELLELYYNHKRVSLEELYERAMSKSFGKRSSA